MSISKAAQELGRKGGQAKSPAKTAAARANASKPRGKWVTAVAYRGKDEAGKEYFGVTVDRGRLNEDEQFAAVCLVNSLWAWVEIEMATRFERLV